MFRAICSRASSRLTLSAILVLKRCLSGGRVGTLLLSVLALAIGCSSSHSVSSGAIGSSSTHSWPLADACSMWPLAEVEKVVVGAKFSAAHPFTTNISSTHMVESRCLYDSNPKWRYGQDVGNDTIHLDVARVSDSQALSQYNHQLSPWLPTTTAPVTQSDLAGFPWVAAAGSGGRYHINQGGRYDAIGFSCTNSAKTLVLSVQSDFGITVPNSKQWNTLVSICNRF